MRYWQLWWQSLIFSIQYDPPGFVEYLMMSFALGLGMKWFFSPEWPYLVLSSSFVIGAAISMLVREWLMPSSRKPMVLVSTLLLLAYSFSSFFYLVRNYGLLNRP